MFKSKKFNFLVGFFLVFFSVNSFAQVDHKNTKDPADRDVINKNSSETGKVGKKTPVQPAFKTAEPKPSPAVADEKEASPEAKAKALLNTSVVPADFPKYSGDISSKEYEDLVAKWFAKNPEKRKTNK